MPFKNNRNSRDDKSKNFSRSAKSSPGSASTKSNRIKSERPDASNNTSKKLFGDGERKPFKAGFKTEDKFNRDRKVSDKPENKKFVKSDDRRFGKPDGRSQFESQQDTAKGKDRPQQSRFGKSIDKPNFRKDDQRSAGQKGADAGRPYTKDYSPGKRRENSASDRKWDSEERPVHVRSKKTEEDGRIRLNRYIANAGICSRRKADDLIAAGVITVNGEAVSELGFKVDPFKDIVRYNGQTLRREKMVYVLLNKPKDYITTTDDPHERRTVMQLVEKASRERIYPVGRLDRNTSGLLLMTNDGDLADKLSHPKNNITKIYQVELNKNLLQGDLNKIAFGLELEDGIIKPDAVSYVQGGTKKEIGVQIHSGKNRVIRRIFEHLGYDVVKLDRVVYGNLTKKDLPRGRWRFLEEKEIIQLKHFIK